MKKMGGGNYLSLLFECVFFSKNVINIVTGSLLLNAPQYDKKGMRRKELNFVRIEFSSKKSQH